MRSHGVTEQRFVVSAFQTVSTRFLFVGPACRQIRQSVDVIVEHRTIAASRPDPFVAGRRQGPDKLAHFFAPHNCRRSLSHSIHFPIPSSVVHETRNTGKAGRTSRAYSSALSRSTGK